MWIPSKIFLGLFNYSVQVTPLLYINFIVLHMHLVLRVKCLYSIAASGMSMFGLIPVSKENT